MRILHTLLFSAIAIGACAQQWELTTAIKTRSKFPAAHMVSAQRGYVLDNVMNAILRTNDGGHTWERMTTLAINAPNAMHMWDGQRGIVVGSSGSIHVTNDGFSTFQSTTANLGSLYSVAFANDTLGLVGTGNGVIRRTTDGGDTWAQMTSGVGTSYTITDLAMPSVDTAFAVAYGVGVLRSTDGGLTWMDTGAPTGMRALHFSDAMNGIVVGNTGAILRTADAGNTWEQMASGVTQNLLSIDRQGDVVLAAGSSGQVTRSTDGGATWTATTVGTNLMTHQSIAIAADGTGFTGTDGRIFGTTDHGATWELVRPGTYHTYLNKISFANGDTGVAVGYETSGGIENGLLRTLDGGRTWYNANGIGGLGVHLRPDGKGIQGGSVGSNARTTDHFETRQTQGAPNVAIRATWCFGEYDHLVAGGYVNSGFYRTTNGGATWQHTPNGASSIFDLYFINDLVGFGVGVGGQIWKSTDAGHTWEQLPHSTANDQFSVFFLNEQVGWTVGATSGARTTDGGQTWINMPNIPSYSMMVHFVNADTGYVVGNSGHTMRSVDGGVTWTNLMPGITNATINDAAYLDGVLVLAGRFGDLYRARVACGTVTGTPMITAVGDTLCASLEGAIQWYRNGMLLEGGDTPCIMPEAEGSYTVVITDALGCASAPSQPYMVVHTGMPGPATIPFHLHPNPANSSLHITRAETTPLPFSVVDTQGRTVLAGHTTGRDTQVDVGRLPTGVYTLRMRDGTVARWVKE
ncbi:MAG: T9SS type A sorting domain-containing protein [Flavobacteriales bacterium]|nr:T9SS type A sorting domain-containing protein [Flavobacteriales bacterium]